MSKSFPKRRSKGTNRMFGMKTCFDGGKEIVVRFEGGISVNEHRSNKKRMLVVVRTNKPYIFIYSVTKKRPRLNVLSTPIGYSLSEAKRR